MSEQEDTETRLANAAGGQLTLMYWPEVCRPLIHSA